MTTLAIRSALLVALLLARLAVGAHDVADEILSGFADGGVGGGHILFLGAGAAAWSGAYVPNPDGEAKASVPRDVPQSR